MTTTEAQRVVGISHILLGEVDTGRDFILPGETAGLLRTKTDLTVSGLIVTVVAGGPRRGETMVIPPLTRVMLQ